MENFLLKSPSPLRKRVVYVALLWTRVKPTKTRNGWSPKRRKNSKRGGTAGSIPHAFFCSRCICYSPFCSAKPRARKMTFPRLQRIILDFSFSPRGSPKVDGSVRLGPPGRSSECQWEVLCGDEGVEK